MIHYHGTPLTPRSELAKMAGKHFCVSFAHPSDADWCQRYGQSVMWDNGAFSAYTRSAPFDAAAFALWVEPRLAHPHWAVVPDVIGGNAEQQDALLRQWPHASHLSAPVWHLDLPISRLLDLCQKWPRVCFGSSGKYWQVGSDSWARRVDAAWDALAKAGATPWVHMLRGLAVGGDRWPFASADSCNVARNFKSARTCPERMARNIDAVQPLSPKWTPRKESQLELGMFHD